MTIDRQKLARVLGMLGSDHNGEVAAAGRAADAMVRGAGLTWHEVLGVEPEDIISEAVAFVLRHRDALSEWERDFVGDIAGRAVLTAKQTVVLRRIWRKANAFARASEAA